MLHTFPVLFLFSESLVSNLSKHHCLWFTFVHRRKRNRIHEPDTIAEPRRIFRRSTTKSIIRAVAPFAVPDSDGRLCCSSHPPIRPGRARQGKRNAERKSNSHESNKFLIRLHSSNMCVCVCVCEIFRFSVCFGLWNVCYCVYCERFFLVYSLHMVAGSRKNPEEFLCALNLFGFCAALSAGIGSQSISLNWTRFFAPGFFCRCSTEMLLFRSIPPTKKYFGISTFRIYCDYNCDPAEAQTQTAKQLLHDLRAESDEQHESRDPKR